MKHQHQVTGTLESIERMPSSLNGNARFLVTVDVPGIAYLIRARTAVDSDTADTVKNFENKTGQQVTIEIGMHYNHWHLIDIEAATVDRGRAEAAEALQRKGISLNRLFASFDRDEVNRILNAANECKHYNAPSWSEPRPASRARQARQFYTYATESRDNV